METQPFFLAQDFFFLGQEIFLTARRKFLCQFLWVFLSHFTELRKHEIDHSINKTPVSGSSIPCFGCETKTEVQRILVIFQHRPVQPHQWKALVETFQMIWLNIGLS